MGLVVLCACLMTWVYSLRTYCCVLGLSRDASELQGGQLERVQHASGRKMTWYLRRYLGS